MKGQTQVISAILILLIALGAVATVAPWANTMIEKRKDSKSVEDAFNFFKAFDEAVRRIAVNGGEETLSLNVPGRLTVYPTGNNITFVFESKISNIAEGDWIPLNTPNANPTATLGIDPSGVIFGKASRVSDELQVSYQLWYRTLQDSAGNGYRIVLNTTDDTEKSTTTGFVRIQRIGSNEVQALTFTEINIIV